LNTIKAEQITKFIEHLSKHGVVTVAAKAAGVSRTGVYMHRLESEDFAKQWDDAMESAADMLESEAVRRAYTGVLKPVCVGGKVQKVREYSDTLLIFLLKGAKPGKFRENHRLEVSGPGGGAIPIREIIVERAAASEEDQDEPSASR
jgi:hypothetical protein